MNFSDLFFLYFFLPLSLICYYAFKKPAYRNIVLLVCSLVFYAWGAMSFLPLLVLAALFNWFIGLCLKRYAGSRGAAFLCGLGILVNLGLLAVFKYAGFITENINALFGASFAVPKLGLPLGISFYTFRLISYLLDVQWEKVEPEKNFGRFLLYVSLFPCAVSGPIVRYVELRDSLETREVSVKQLSAGANRLIAGLAKKVLIADMLSSVTSELFGADVASVSVLGCWFGAMLFALQMYFDFSGYSDMAIGIAGLFGLPFPENFNYPFLCKSIAEFWQRWHITLGSFFRDYLLYVPIFGRQRKYGGLFLVWLATGIWHGAAWNYIIWGLYFGLFILIETMLGKKRMKKIPLWIKHVCTKLILIVGFGIFRFEDTAQLGAFLRGLIGANGNAFCDSLLGHTAANNLFLIAVALLFCFPVIPALRRRLERTPAGTILCGAGTVVCNVALLVISSILLVSATSNPFLYANF